MNIRARVFGGKPEDSSVLKAKPAKGAKTETLKGVQVRREESRCTNTREEDRHRLPDETASVTHQGRSYDAQLVNLSGGGAMIEADFEPKLWDRLELHLGENGTIECVVRWLKDGRVGLEFAHETRLDCSAHQQAEVLREIIAKSFPDVEFEALATAAEDEPLEHEHRRDRRHPLIWSGEIHHDYQSTPVRLRNISETGAMIECSAPLPVGAEPLLDLGEGVTMFATVTWVVGDSVGLRFQSPFDLSQLARARPQIAPARWEQPTYLQSDRTASSPWDEQWGRMSLGELRDQLESFLKR